MTNEIINHNISKIGLDSEYYKGNKYQGHLCLLQISYILKQKKVFIVDLLKFDRNIIISKLSQILNSQKIEKIIHASENDCEWIFEDFGIYVRNIFDTQEIFCLISESNKKVGLNHILNKYFHLNLDKAKKLFFQTSDWNRKPLSNEQLEYAAMDTNYLIDLREKLMNDLNNKLKQMNKKKKKKLLDRQDDNKNNNPSESEFSNLKDNIIHCLRDWTLKVIK